MLGTYLQFGGHVELDENPWQTVAHEVLEETGYDLNQLKIMQPKSRLRKLTGVTLHPEPVIMLSHEFSPGHFHTDIEYLFVATGEPSHAVGNDESTDIRAFSQAELMDESIPNIPENIREVGSFILSHRLIEWEPVDVSEFSLD
ncbi:MAG: pyrophosphohydrolase including oxidative damage repair enzyme [Candidatus Saccharibacteria bacterium]|nr:pyrophosphohydrolase including oxidative damage repair enzyme [Candidatus Saccharibacteria bacterium]